MSLLPAGTAHKKVDASSDFLVVGGYPDGQEDYDLICDDPSAQAAAEQRIAGVPVPESDPLYGDDGPMRKHWRCAQRANRPKGDGALLRELA